MRSEAQKQASRVNGAKSKGPATDEGKAVSRLNGLKHGLRAEQVVLPGEDPADFEAEQKAWLDDWRPGSHTRAVLVERAAVASWRLRRAARAEAARLAKGAADAARDFDLDRLARVDRAVARFEDDPAAALSVLEIDATGLDRLIRSWRELGRALGQGPGGWSEPLYHARLMLLLGRRPEAGPAVAGPEAVASARLVASNAPGSCEPMPDDEALEAVVALRRLVAKRLRALRVRRRSAEDPASARSRAAEAASAEAVASKEEQLRHRYEMAHERSLRESLRLLLALARSGADLAESEPEPAAPEPEAIDTEPPTDKHVEPSHARASGSLGARRRGLASPSLPAPPRPPKAPDRAATGGGGGRSRR